MKGKIYVLKHPDTKQIRYVGQTIQKLENRMNTHIYDSLYRNKGKYNTRKCNWFKKLFRESKSPIIECIEEVNKSDLDSREIYWIKFYRDSGYDLLNLTDGGFFLPERFKKYQKKIQSRKIYGINRKTLQRKTFKSVKLAAKFVNINPNNIPKAIHIGGEAGGYFWSYAKFPKNYKPPKKKGFRQVVLKDINTNKLYEFDSRRKAIEFTKGTVKSNKNGADYALRHEDKEYRGYYWYYREAIVKPGELLEHCDVNQQPSSSNSDNKVEEKVQRLTVEDSDTNKTDTSAGQPSYDVIRTHEIGITKVPDYISVTEIDDIVRATEKAESVELQDKEPVS